MPFERGSCFSSTGTIPEGLTASDCPAMARIILKNGLLQRVLPLPARAGTSKR
jgi:hypothetical protein